MRRILVALILAGCSSSEDCDPTGVYEITETVVDDSCEKPPRLGYEINIRSTTDGGWQMDPGEYPVTLDGCTVTATGEISVGYDRDGDFILEPYWDTDTYVLEIDGNDVTGTRSYWSEVPELPCEFTIRGVRIQ